MTTPCCSRRAEDHHCASVVIDALDLSYGARQVLRRVTMTVPPCGVTAIIGPSGCGKSSLLCAINRLTDLIPGCRVSGTVRVGETSIYDAGTDLIELRRRVGMVFQKPNPFPLSIRRNIELPLRETGIRDKACLAEATERVLRDVGLFAEVKDRLDQPALRLSGGQQQRLCIARALVLEPRIILFDEPCSALDPIASAVVEELIAGLRGSYTVLIVTHNLAQARRIADQVGLFWVMEDAGELVEFGEREAFFEHPQHDLTKAYLSGAKG